MYSKCDGKVFKQGCCDLSFVLLFSDLCFCKDTDGFSMENGLEREGGSKTVSMKKMEMMLLWIRVGGSGERQGWV